jgi:hypothetical protein
MTNHKSDRLYVQFGAGNQSVPGWVSFDASPTLVIQNIPILGQLLRPKLNCIFDKEIKYGDIVKGLPIADESVDGLFCSHVLEHLSYADFSTALNNSYRYLKKGAIFRIVVPDLEWYVRQYVQSKQSSSSLEKARASSTFMKGTCLGLEESRMTLRRRLSGAFGGSGHRWMWDYDGLSTALADHGFADIKRFTQGHSEDEMFLRPERDHQFGSRDNPYGLAVECRKPTYNN